MGQAVRARAEERSSACVRVPLWSKAPRSSRRCRSSRSGTRGGSSADAIRREGVQASRGCASVTRAFGGSERGTRELVRKRALPSLVPSSPQTTSSRQWSAMWRKPPCSVCGSRASGAATRRRSQRSRNPSVPTSSGARVPFACEDWMLAGRARVSLQLQKSASEVETPRSEVPVGSGLRRRGSSPLGLERARADAKASTTVIAVAKPRWR